MDLNIDIGTMVNDVSKIVSTHIEKVFLKFNKENKDVVDSLNVIKNLPIIKKLIEENERLKIENEILKNKNIDNQIKLKITDLDNTLKLVSDEDVKEKIKNIHLNNNNNSFKRDILELNTNYLNNNSFSHFYDSEDDEEQKINPFPEGTQGYLNFNMGLEFPLVNTAPSVWALNKKAPPNSILLSYPELDWSLVEGYKESNNEKSIQVKKLNTTIEEEDKNNCEIKGPSEIERDNKEEVEKEEQNEFMVTFAKTVLKAQQSDDYATIDTDEDEEHYNEEEKKEEEEEEEEEKEEEEEEEEEKEEEEEEEEEKEEEEEDEKEEEEEEEEEEVEVIEIDDIEYYTNDSQSGNIYAIGDDGDPGDKIGWLENGISFFS